MITLNEAVKISGLTHNAFHHRINRKQIPAKKKGGVWYIKSNIVKSLIPRQPTGYKNPGRLSHGLSNTGTYKSWSSMKSRCYNPNSGSYEYYGDRGIKVCKRWRESFEAFLADMGERPPGKTLDRKDNDKGYKKSNCRWATPIEQRSNRRDSK